MNNFGKPMKTDELVNIRKGLRMTQKDLAGLAGTTDRTIQNWEGGKQDVPGSVAVLMRLLNNHRELFPEALGYAGMD